MLPGINTFHGGVGDKGRPYFDVVGKRNVTAVVGQTARLNCRVKHLGDQQVSILVFLNLCIFKPFYIYISKWIFQGDKQHQRIHEFYIEQKKKVSSFILTDIFGKLKVGACYLMFIFYFCNTHTKNRNFLCNTTWLKALGTQNVFLNLAVDLQLYFHPLINIDTWQYACRSAM